LKLARIKSDIRSHQITLESNKDSLVQLEVKISNILVQLEESKRHGFVQLEDMKDQFNKEFESLFVNMNRK